MILGFSGKIGSGKSTLSAEVANQLNWKHASFGLYVQKVALSKNIAPTRENLQNLGARLLSDNAKKFCLSVVKESNWAYGESLVIEGIRHEEVIEIIRDITKPDIFKLIFLKISDKNIRKSRIANRDNTPINEADEHPTEKEVMNNTLLKRADLIVDAEKDISGLKNQIIQWIGEREGYK
jgi:cytidylate kinase